MQSVLAVALSVGLLGMDVQGPVWLLTLVAVADAVLGSALGLFVSAFAQTEFQAVQFMPAVVIPQILLCGLFVAREDLPPFLEAVSNVLPLSYAVDAMQTLTRTSDTGDVWVDVLVVGVLRGGGPGPRRCHPPAAHRVACRPMHPLRQPILLLARSKRSRSSSSTMPVSAGSCTAMSPVRPPRRPSTPPPPSSTTGSR